MSSEHPPYASDRKRWGTVATSVIALDRWGGPRRRSSARHSLRCNPPEDRSGGVNWISNFGSAVDAFTMAPSSPPSSAKPEARDQLVVLPSELLVYGVGGRSTALLDARSHRCPSGAARVPCAGWGVSLR